MAHRDKPQNMPYCVGLEFLLETIASSVADAVEAEAGGAGRIEFCIGLAGGGFTPPVSMVREALREVTIPVRVMVCDHASYETPGQEELRRLQDSMRAFAELDIAGVVIGFARGDLLDASTVRDLIACAPHLRVTFHRVFERLADPLGAINELKTVPQVDRILLATGEWDRLAKAAAPRISLIAGGGLRAPDFQRLLRTTSIREFHTGRAVREQQKTDGRVEARLVRSLLQEIAET